MFPTGNFCSPEQKYRRAKSPISVEGMGLSGRRQSQFWPASPFSIHSLVVVVHNGLFLFFTAGRWMLIKWVCLLCFFITRHHTDAWYWYSKSVCLSVCLPVRQLRYAIVWNRLNIFHRTVAQSFYFYKHQTPSLNSDGVTPYGGAKYRWSMKILRYKILP